MKQLRISLLMTMLVILTACGEESTGTDVEAPDDSTTPPDKTTNIAPTANAGPNQNVSEQSVVNLIGSASNDTDGNIVSYSWQQTQGTTVTLSDTSLVSPTFTSPDVEEDETLTFTLSVTDDDGDTDTDSVNINITAIIIVPGVNTAPIANASVDQTVDAQTTVTLKGSDSSDTDGTISSFSWLQTSGTSVTLTNANSASPNFTAPNITTDETLTFQLTVTDNEGATASDLVNINVVAENVLPTANAGLNQTVNEQTTVTLDGSNSSDSDGTIVSYSWLQSNGTPITLSDATAQSPTFTAPDVSENETLRFQLTITDNDGGSDTDTVNINITAIENATPTANAGANQTVDEQTTVTLNGSNSSDSDGTITNYSWEQTTGTPVTLSNATTQSATFTAPDITTDETLTFQLTVTDNDGDTATDTITINITAISEGGSDPVVSVNKLIGNAFSGTSIGLSWENSGSSYSVYRDGNRVANAITDNYFIDESLTVNTSYVYSVTTGDVNDASATSTVTAKTLVNTTNDGTDNGAETVIFNQRLNAFPECTDSGRDTSLDIAENNLDNCLGAMLEYNSMSAHLEDMRAFAARVRSEQSPAKIELGMKLFHNKSLGANNDTACSSCHHPALGCGGDDLSMPIGVDAVTPNLLGPGRSDGINTIPIVPRNSPATCNTSLWDRGLFWDNRVSLTGRGVNTDSDDVSSNVQDAVGGGSLALLMAQAHFPVTAAPEMGDATAFGYDASVDGDLTDYREDVLASRITTDVWGDMFSAAFGDNTINFSRIAEAMAAYEAVQIFIDNPFFDYVDGNTNAITSDEKRGAITFMAGSTGCTFCHAGAFFSTQAPLPGNYPQIGVGTSEDGSGADLAAQGLTGSGAFRAPTLLNVGITGPWGHNGQFGTLKRNVEHYTGHGASIAAYFANNEMCDLEQFADLEDCANELAPNGLALSESILAGNTEFSNNISDAEVDVVVLFLETLTDPDAANPQSNAIRALIPANDPGPNGNQLNAIDKEGNLL